MVVRTSPPALSAREAAPPPGGSDASRWPYRTTLRDGTPVAIRPLSPDDVPRLEAIVAHLSPASRYHRFLTPVDRIPRADATELCRCDEGEHLALVAEVEGPDGRVESIGAAHCIRLEPSGDVAEVACEVVDAWQKRGVGTLLLNVIAGCAWRCGVRHWQALMHENNAGIQKAIAAVAEPVRRTVQGYGLVEIAYDLHED